MIFGSAMGSRESSMCPASTRAMSRTSLMRSSRCRPPLRMYCDALLLEGSERLLVEDLSEAEDGVEGGAQFVAHAREELRFRVIGLVGLLLRREQLGVGLRDLGRPVHNPRLQLFVGSAQRDLGLFDRSDVVGGAVEEALEGDGSPRQPAVGAVAAEAAIFEIEGYDSPAATCAILGDRGFPVVRMHEIQDGICHQLSTCISSSGGQRPRVLSRRDEQLRHVHPRQAVRPPVHRDRFQRRPLRCVRSSGRSCRCERGRPSPDAPRRRARGGAPAR